MGKGWMPVRQANRTQPGTEGSSGQPLHCKHPGAGPKENMSALGPRVPKSLEARRHINPFDVARQSRSSLADGWVDLQAICSARHSLDNMLNAKNQAAMCPAVVKPLFPSTWVPLLGFKDPVEKSHLSGQDRLAISDGHQQPDPCKICLWCKGSICGWRFSYFFCGIAMGSFGVGETLAWGRLLVLELRPRKAKATDK